MSMALPMAAARRAQTALPTCSNFLSGGPAHSTHIKSLVRVWGSAAVPFLPQRKCVSGKPCMRAYSRAEKERAWPGCWQQARQCQSKV